MEWDRSRVKLPVRSPDPTVTAASVECDAAGSLAVHMGICDDAGWWCVTHTRSGLRVARVPDQEQALRLAQALNNRCASALVATTREAVLDRMPLDVFKWLQACKEANAYLKPPWEKPDSAK